MASQTLDDDRLSLLPDELLHHILHFIPDTEEKARTSALSRRFRHLWTHHPAIRLGSNKDLRFINLDDLTEINNYLLSVDRCFASLRSTTLDSLDLNLHDTKSSAGSNARWIRFAAARSVRDLSLRCAPMGREALIPGSIFSCKNLTRFGAISCTLTKIPSHFQGFRLLTDLRFFCSSIGDKPLASLISKCPLIETLSLHACDGLKRIVVSSDRLKHVSVSCCWLLEEARFDAPNLYSVQFNGNAKVLFLKGAEFLRSACILHYYFAGPHMMLSADWERCLSGVSHTSESLEVNRWLFKDHGTKFVLPPRNVSPMLKDLKELKCVIEWLTAPVIRGLAVMLQHCPNLRRLYVNVYIGNRRTFMFHQQQLDALCLLIESVCPSIRESLPPVEEGELYLRHRDDFHKEYKEDQAGEIWDPSEQVGAFGESTLGLKTVAVKGFLGTANEMKLLEYLLSRATALEKLTIGDCRLGDKEDIHQLLSYIPRASPLVQICEMEMGFGK